MTPEIENQNGAINVGPVGNQESTPPNQAPPRRATGRGGWRPNAGRKSKGVAIRLRLVQKLNTLDRTQQRALLPLLESEGVAVAAAQRALDVWEQARVAAEIAIEVRCATTRAYLESRAALLATIAALGPIHGGILNTSSDAAGPSVADRLDAPLNINKEHVT